MKADMKIHCIAWSNVIRNALEDDFHDMERSVILWMDTQNANGEGFSNFSSEELEEIMEAVQAVSDSVALEIEMIAQRT